MPRLPRPLVQLVLAAFLCANVGLLAAPSGVRAAWASDSFSSADEDLMVQLTNEARAAAGLAALPVNADLRDLARWRSKDMIERDYFSHSIPPEGYSVFHYMNVEGIAYSWAAENIGWNTYPDSTATQTMFDVFMDSSGHRANILDARATDIGVGAYKGTFQGVADTHMYTMLFIQAPSGDTTPPSVTPPASRLYYPSKLGSTTAPVRTSWSASDSSGVASYKLQRQGNGGSWSTMSLSSATAKSITQSLTIGATYRYRVRATDTAGNTSGYAYGPTFKPLRTQESSTAVTYGGTWKTAANSSASGGYLKYTTAAGAWASFTFTGSSIAWVAYRGPNRGSANVYLDGAYKATISLYSSTYASKRIVYAASWAGNGSHTIKIVAVGTAGHPRVDLDAFVRLRNL